MENVAAQAGTSLRANVGLISCIRQVRKFENESFIVVLLYRKVQVKQVMRRQRSLFLQIKGLLG